MATFPGWEPAVLQGIGAPVTKENVAFLDAWQKHEGGTAANNPLNTTQPAAGSTAYNTNSGYPVRNYVSPQQGVAATVATLQNGRYPDVVRALQTGNAPAALVSGKVSAQKVADQIKVWGSVNFANLILGQKDRGLGGAITDAAGSAGSAIVGNVPGVGAVVDAGSAVAGFVGTVTNPHNILRAGEVIAGGALVAMGLFLLAKQIGLAEPVGGAVGAAIGGPAGAIAGSSIGRKPEAKGPSPEDAFYEGVAAGKRADRQPLAARNVDRAGAGVETRVRSAKGRRLPNDDGIPF